MLSTWSVVPLPFPNPTYAFGFSQFTYQRRQWQPTPVSLPGKSHGQRTLVGYSPWSHEELDMTERLHFHFHALEKEMTTHSSILAWKVPWVEKPGGLQSMELQRVGHDWSNLAPLRKQPVWGGRWLWNQLEFKFEVKVDLKTLPLHFGDSVPLNSPDTWLQILSVWVDLRSCGQTLQLALPIASRSISSFHEEKKVLVAQLCLTLCNPMDCSPPGFSVHGTFQARILEWVDISSFRGSSWPRDRTGDS